MPISELRLIKRCAEFRAPNEIRYIPRSTRGIYTLLRKRPGQTKRLDKYDVVYIGMAGGIKAGIAGRLRAHLRRKRELWTHFSIFEVWDNITAAEIEELEGLLRHIYRKDQQANHENRQRGFKKLRKVKTQNLRAWHR